MSGFYTEADYENSIIELFRNMGYRYPSVDMTIPSSQMALILNARRLSPELPISS